MASGRYPSVTAASRTPCFFSSFSAYSITGRSSSRIMGLGQSHVKGRSLDPSPPAMMIAFMQIPPSKKNT